MLSPRAWSIPILEMEAPSVKTPRTAFGNPWREGYPFVHAYLGRRGRPPMLILPPGHAQQLGARRGLSQREKWMVRGVLALVAVLAIVLAVSLLTRGQSSRHGCIYVTIPAATGAQQVNECGATARSTCLSASA